MTVPLPGPHGGDAHRLADALGVPTSEVLDLSASLNPFAPDSRAILRDAVDSLDRYPDDDRATAALAEILGCPAERLVLTNGGAEAIALVAAEHPRGWADECEFSLYRRHLAELDPNGPRWMSDPHNPTGRLAPTDDVADVRDEAFYVLATGRWTRGDDAIVLGSLTKAFALPGLRVGYVVTRDDGEADRIRRRRPRWAVNGLVAACLPALLDVAEPTRWRARIAAQRDDLVSLLDAHDLRTEPGAANYVWVPFAPGLRERLARRLVLVRDGTSFGHPDAVRIAVPDDAGMEILHRALEESR